MLFKLLSGFNYGQKTRTEGIVGGGALEARHVSIGPASDAGRGTVAARYGEVCGWVANVDREAVLSQLSGIGWAIASDWMALHVGWDQVSLHLIKHVGLAASRLDALVEDGAVLNVDQIRKEIAAYTALIAAIRHAED